MKHWRSVAIYVAALILLVSFLSSCDRESSNIIARVGTRLITVQEFEQEFARGKSTQAVRDATLEEKRKFLDDLINRKMKIIDGYQHNLDKDKAILEKLAEQEREFKFFRLIDREVVEKIIPESLLRDYYDKSSREVKISQIAINFDPNNAEQKQQALKRAQDILARLKHDENFNAVARETSEDPNTAKMGGSKGYLKWGIVSYDDPIYVAAFSLKKSEISKPIETRNAYFIIKVDDIKNYPYQPFEQNREKIRNQFTTFRRNQIYEGYYKYLDELKARYHFKFDAKNLEFFLTKLNQRPDSSANVPQNLQERTIANFNEAEKKKILASYDDGRITIGDVIIELSKFPARRRPQFTDVSAVQEFINTYRNLGPLRLLAIACEEKNIDQDAEFKKFVAGEREKKILEHITRIQVQDKAEVTAEDVRAYFEQHREEYKKPEMRDVQQIFVKDLKTAEIVAKRARQGSDFGRLFRQYNEDESLKTEQGKTTMSKGRAVLGNVVFKMKVDDISDPIKLGVGYYVVKLLAINEPTLQIFEEAEKFVTPAVRKLSYEQREAEWVAALRKRIDFVIYEQNLEKAGKRYVGDDVVYTE